MPKRKSSDAHFIDLTKEIDVERFRESVKANFLDFPDPRRAGSVVYPVWSILFIILSGYLAGGNTLSDIAHFGYLKREWFKELLGIRQIPSYDTLWWFLVRTTPDAFKCLMNRWLGGISNDLRNQLLVVDGKRLKGISDSTHIVHVVEMFAAESGLTIAQEKVPEKSSEPAALPALLDSVNVTGAIVSMDALYATVSNTQEVLARGADYIVGLKDNQPLLKDELVNFFEQARVVDYEGINVTTHSSEGKGHGRGERRVVTVTQDLDWLPQAASWNLRSIVEVRSERVVKKTIENSVRYYVSSRAAPAEDFARWIRSHWSIENNLHYVLDVVFCEDASLADTGYSAENIAIAKRIAMNIVARFDPHRGMTDARRSATYDLDYLRGLLARVFC